MIANLDDENSKEANELLKILKRIGVELNTSEKSLQGKSLMKKIFQKWINVADAVVDMVIMKLPSPVEA